MHAALAADLRAGTHTVPGFGHALERHRLLGAIEEASRTRTGQPLTG